MPLLYWENSLDRVKVISALKNNKIVISSTDTILGFLANSTYESYEKIIALKQTTTRRPFLLLVASIDKLSHFVDMESLPENLHHFVTLCWPGPVTFIFHAKKNAPSFLISPQKTIAIRCPNHNGLQEILSEFDGLFSSSANKTMETPPEQFADISRDILRKIDLVILDEDHLEEATARQHDTPPRDTSLRDTSPRDTSPSTIVDLTQADGSFPFKVVRQGAVEEEELRALYTKIEKQ